MKPLRLLRVCGLGLCALSAAFSISELVFSQNPLRVAGCIGEDLARRASVPVSGIAVLEFGLIGLAGYLFWELTQQVRARHRRGGVWWLIAGQTAIGLLVATELLVLVSFAAPLALRAREARRFILLLIALHTSSYYLQWLLTGGHPLATLMNLPGQSIGWPMVLMAATTAVMHGVTASMGFYAAEERRRSVQLSRTNAELMATRRLEAETARVAERLGISRELHDAAGHRLAALSVNLRVMGRLADSPAIQQKAEECLFLVSELLEDVRDTVRDLRALGRIDLKSILETMVAGIEEFEVHLKVDPALAEAESYHAHTLYRCAQEILTNALKHGNPANLWLTVARTDAGFSLEGRDDGAGQANFEFGFGLSGMRERVVELGGEFGVQSRAGDGFQVRLTIPVRRSAA